MRPPNASSSTPIALSSPLDQSIAHICASKGNAFNQITSLAKAMECINTPTISITTFALGIAALAIGLALEIPIAVMGFYSVSILLHAQSATNMKQELAQVIAQAAAMTQDTTEEHEQQIDRLNQEHWQLTQQLAQQRTAHAMAQKNLDMLGFLEDLSNAATALTRGEPKELDKLFTAYNEKLMTLRQQPKADTEALDVIQARFASLISLAEQFEKVWGARTGQTLEAYTVMAQQVTELRQALYQAQAAREQGKDFYMTELKKAEEMVKKSHIINTLRAKLEKKSQQLEASNQLLQLALHRTENIALAIGQAL